MDMCIGYVTFNSPRHRTSLISFQCTTPSVKGPIATLDASKGPEPLKLTIYETFHDKYDTNPMPGFQGVSVLLLDYLMITGMLLVTDLQEWMLVRKADGQGVANDSDVAGPSFAPDVPFRSDPKFRKIMYGEPIFPKLSGEGTSKSSVKSRSRSPTTLARRPSTPMTPDSGMPRFVYPESDGLSSPDPSASRGRYPSMTDSDDDDEDELDTFSLVETRSTSAIADNYNFSSTEPSHNYHDATFSSSEELPPVPPLPFQYAKSFRNFSSQPSTPVSGTFAPSREHPLLPSELISRPRSSPPLESSVAGSSRDSRQYSDSLEHPRVHSIARSESVLSQTSSMSRPGSSAARRPLPRPPPVPPISSSPPPARRVQSSSQLANYPVFAKDNPSRLQRSLPPTPGIITSPTSTSSLMHDMNAVHSRLPPITKVSQEDLTNYVHALTSPQRDLPPQPLPSTSIYDVPPPSYNSIAFDNPPSQHRRPSLPLLETASNPP